MNAFKNVSRALQTVFVGVLNNIHWVTEIPVQDKYAEVDFSEIRIVCHAKIRNVRYVASCMYRWATVSWSFFFISWILTKLPIRVLLHFLMRRLFWILVPGPNSDPSGASGFSTMMMMMIGWLVIATALYLLRPSSMRRQGNEKPAPMVRHLTERWRYTCVFAFVYL